MNNSGMKILKTISLTAVLLFPSSLFPAIWGVSAINGRGNFDMTSKPYLFQEKQASGDAIVTGAGFSVDSFLPEDNLYNIRFNLIFSKTDLDSSDFKTDESLSGFYGDFIFRVRLYTNNYLKFWLGPDLLLGIVDGKGEEFTRRASARVTGVGLILGSDIAMGDNYIFSLTAGVRTEIYRPSGQYGTDTELKGNTTYAYLMATFFFLKTGYTTESENKPAGI